MKKVEETEFDVKALSHEFEEIFFNGSESVSSNHKDHLDDLWRPESEPWRLLLEDTDLKMCYVSDNSVQSSDHCPLFVEPQYSKPDDLFADDSHKWVFSSPQYSDSSHSVKKGRKRIAKHCKSFALPSVYQKKRKRTIQSDARVGCRCKMSKCLRLHCRCFKDKEYCMKYCKCIDCLNQIDKKDIREFAIEKTIEIYSNAFKPKIISLEQQNSSKVNIEGCSCRTGCSRNYCECFKSGVNCSTICKCIECQNSRIILKSDLTSQIPRPNRNKNRIVFEKVSEVKKCDDAELIADVSCGLLEEPDSPQYVSEISICQSISDKKDFKHEKTKKNHIIKFQDYKRINIDELPI